MKNNMIACWKKDWYLYLEFLQQKFVQSLKLYKGGFHMLDQIVIKV